MIAKSDHPLSTEQVTVGMQPLWCWRCQRIMPMLEEPEFAEIWAAYQRCIPAVRQLRQEQGVPLREAVQAAFTPVRELYEQLTGMREVHQDEIVKHRLALYGPPCPACGKPFRTPRARFCAACGYRPSEPPA
jgi:hypothetical protein